VQYEIFMIVRRFGAGTGISVGKVADRLHRSGAFTTIEAAKLAERGLIEKRPDPADGRKVLLAPTAAEDVPPGHATQLAAPAALAQVPAAQGAQVAAPAAEKLPAAQDTQVVALTAPTTFDAVPAGQLMQMPAPAPLNVPAWHCVSQ
jgi:hypothetical protein